MEKTLFDDLVQSLMAPRCSSFTASAVTLFTVQAPCRSA
jgi:hypothetical protein